MNFQIGSRVSIHCTAFDQDGKYAKLVAKKLGRKTWRSVRGYGTLVKKKANNIWAVKWDPILSEDSDDEILDSRQQDLKLEKRSKKILKGKLKTKSTNKSGFTNNKMADKKSKSKKQNKPTIKQKEEYEVEQIIDDHYEDGQWLYRIRWKGWGEDGDTWEKKENIFAPKLIHQYVQQKKAKNNTGRDMTLDDIRVDAKYEVKFELLKGRGFKWYAGKVTAISASHISIMYDFGNKLTYSKKRIGLLILDGSLRTISKKKNKKRKFQNSSEKEIIAGQKKNEEQNGSEEKKKDATRKEETKNKETKRKEKDEEKKDETKKKEKGEEKKNDVTQKKEKTEEKKKDETKKKEECEEKKKGVEEQKMKNKKKKNAEFEVERIINRKFVNGKWLYRIRWKNYGKEADTWEPQGDIFATDLIKEFIMQQQAKKRKNAGNLGDETKTRKSMRIEEKVQNPERQSTNTSTTEKMTEPDRLHMKLKSKVSLMESAACKVQQAKDRLKNNPLVYENIASYCQMLRDKLTEWENRLVLQANEISATEEAALTKRLDKLNSALSNSRKVAASTNKSTSKLRDQLSFPVQLEYNAENEIRFVQASTRPPNFSLYGRLCRFNCQVFHESGFFISEEPIKSLSVLLIGGGGGGAAGRGGGGGSGYCVSGKMSTAAGEVITVKVGSGGRGESGTGERIHRDALDGESSHFGDIIATGGKAGQSKGKGGAGGSGGGGGKTGEIGSEGGSKGSDGCNGDLGIGGKGNGKFSFAYLAGKKFSFGKGGSSQSKISKSDNDERGILSYGGGGGGGGIHVKGYDRINGEHGELLSGNQGGSGFGAGGAGGGYFPITDRNGKGGDGARGVVYVQWYTN